MLTNHKSNRSKKWRYLGILPLMLLMLTLFHTSAEQGRAGAVLDTYDLLSLSETLLTKEGIPSQFPLPVIYKEKITWGYNQEALHPITGKETTHLGIDVAAPTGTPVFATGDGVVSKASEEKGWGKLVVVEHEHGYATFYAHMDAFVVEIGTKVVKGEVIGSVGNTGQSTGSHLHYEVRLNGDHQNPADFY